MKARRTLSSRKRPADYSTKESRGTSSNPTTLRWSNARAWMHDVTGQAHCLGLDRTTQQFAMAQLRAAKPRQGAIVVVRVTDGRVLAAADYPPHTPRQKSVLWSALTPSASLFKLVTTAALIEEAGLTSSHRVCSEGGEHRISAEQLSTPRRGNIRCQTFDSILSTSRNAAYARLVTAHLTTETLSNFANRFGFNQDRSATIPYEFGRYEPAFTPLGLARTATGFKGSTLSTFGAAHLGFVVATGGRDLPLRLYCDEDPFARGLAADESNVERVLEPTTATRLREMMESVIRHGTAHDAFFDEAGRPRLPRVSVAGKTGTLSHDEETSSWFTGFAPSRSPELVVAVLLDNGPVWRVTAKQVAVELFRRHFEEATRLSASSPTALAP
ncbi:MAG: penicillin-binding transpeptidase domain-containing protein [Polyangiaceae bacterium]